MRYKDLAHPTPSLLLNPQCLAWTANHEHAVFGIEDEIHPKSVVIWLEYTPLFPPFPVIEKYRSIDGDWHLIETSDGEIPLVNNNPFDPRKNNAASNTAASVFPQNR